MKKLRPNGVLSITRWESEAPRLLGTVSRAGRSQRWANIGDHLLAQKGANVVTVLASPTAFTETERTRAATASQPP